MQGKKGNWDENNGPLSRGKKDKGNYPVRKSRLQGGEGEKAEKVIHRQNYNNLIAKERKRGGTDPYIKARHDCIACGLVGRISRGRWGT